MLKKIIAAATAVALVSVFASPAAAWSKKQKETVVEDAAKKAETKAKEAESAAETAAKDAKEAASAAHEVAKEVPVPVVHTDATNPHAPVAPATTDSRVVAPAA